MNARNVLLCSLVPWALLAAREALAAGDAALGARAFGQCAACHSVKPDRHMTGPSLAAIWGRKAGSAENFGRYSEALKGSSVVWNEETLDRWLANPAAMIPGNQMTFPGIADSKVRSGLIAYLRSVSEGKAPSAPRGMMGDAERTPLQEIDARAQVEAIRYCNDTYHVTTAGGKTYPFWEFNLRFKTDSGPDGPARGKPVLIRGGMMGDRAFVIFPGPEDMAAFIKRECR